LPCQRVGHEGRFALARTCTEKGSSHNKSLEAIMSIPFLVPMPRPAVLDAPGRFSADPVGVYINRLGVGSRRGQIGALDTVASFLHGRPAMAVEVDWSFIRYNQTSAVRGWLVSKYRPATCKRILAAVRGVLKESWRLGLMSHEDCARACDIAA